tara:strand:+ start:2456 stop:3457 length:1002 start_codon:yes stop_codon:yes gene_type:complete
MFDSVAAKITTYFVTILVAISLILGIILFGITTVSSDNRFSELENILEEQGLGVLLSTEPRLSSNFQRNQELIALRQNIILLLIVSIILFSISGLACYRYVRNLLGPIQRAHEAQSRFTSDASHEFKTPLASIKSELEVALRDPKLTKAEMRELLESNLEEVDRLTKLTQTLLLLSRLDYANLAFRPVDLNKTIAESVQKYGDDIKRIRYILPSDSVVIEGNASTLQELIMIFVDNAIKYSYSGSIITLRLVENTKNIKLKITNHGKVIPSEKLPYIFDRFFRADEARSGNSGTGLGLALAREIIKLHGGRVTVSSKNNLTSFTVILPLKKNK